MAAYAYSEDTLVQQTTAEYLRDELGWESVYAYNNETFGPEGLWAGVGPGGGADPLPAREARGAESRPARGRLRRRGAADRRPPPPPRRLIATNREKYALIKDGVQVTFRNDKGERVQAAAAGVRFRRAGRTTTSSACGSCGCGATSTAAGRTSSASSTACRCCSWSCKNVHKDIRAAYEKNLTDYKDTIPHLFHHNAIIVLGNGVEAKIGSITSRFEHFHEWKRLAEDEPGVVDMETLLKGVCDKRNFMDLLENFILFDDSTGETAQDPGPQPPVPGRQPGHRGGARPREAGRASWASSGTPRGRARATRWSCSPARSTASSAATSPS